MEKERRVEMDKSIKLVSWFPPCLLVSPLSPGFPFILIILVEYRQRELLYREVDESMGPNELDCPMRIMN